MALAWTGAAVVTIGVGSSLAGEYDTNYNTPGSESQAASELTDHFRDLLGIAFLIMVAAAVVSRPSGSGVLLGAFALRPTLLLCAEWSCLRRHISRLLWTTTSSAGGQCCFSTKGALPFTSNAER